MSTISLTCPACHFTRRVASARIPQKECRVTCPACQHRFSLSVPPAASSAPEAPPPRRSLALTTSPGGGDLRQPKNILLAALFILFFLALLGGRLYTSHRALNIPSPNFIAVADAGIATLWKNEVIVTDQAGRLVRRIPLPHDLIPAQMLWVDSELWFADYRTKEIVILGAGGERRIQLTGGPKISGLFKLFPDLSQKRIYLSAGHAIHLYDQQGLFQRSFGSAGREPGQLMFPNQFLLEDSGSLLIANTKSPAIDRYSPEGTFLGRVVTPTGHGTYIYPTNVAVGPDRIVTLEADGYLQNARLALYDSQGKYLGEHEAVPDFKLIGDIAVTGDQVLATDLANKKVYAFALSDLHLLGEYSPDLARLGNEFVTEQRYWEKFSKFTLGGLVALLIPIAIFYFKFRKAQSALLPGDKAGDPGKEEAQDSNRKTSQNRGDLDQLPRMLRRALLGTSSTPDGTPRPPNYKAALLSALFPGLGQFYKRHIIRGALLMVFFVPIVLTLAVNFRPILDGSIDWAPQSIFGMGMTVRVGVTLFALNIWDALKN